MSTDTALTMDELELETAELLPSRETLGCCYYKCFPVISVTATATASVSVQIG